MFPGEWVISLTRGFLWNSKKSVISFWRNPQKQRNLKFRTLNFYNILYEDSAIDLRDFEKEEAKHQWITQFWKWHKNTEWLFTGRAWKGCKLSPLLLNFILIQPRTSCLKLTEKKKRNERKETVMISWSLIFDLWSRDQRSLPAIPLVISLLISY